MNDWEYKKSMYSSFWMSKQLKVFIPKGFENDIE
jgi:hypothetical protein